MTRRLALLVTLNLVACSSGTSPSLDCTDFDLGGTCFSRPTDVVARTTCGTYDTFCSPTPAAVELACLAATPATPTVNKVVVAGFVDVFATGPSTSGLSIQLFEASSLATGGDPSQLTPRARATTALALGVAPCPSAADPSLCTQADASTLRACDADPALGCVAPVVAGCSVDCADGLDGRADKGMYCRAGDGGTTSCNQRSRWEAPFQFGTILPDGTGGTVPTDTPLVVRVSGPLGTSDQVWATTIAFDIIIPASPISCATDGSIECVDATGRYRLDLTAMSQADYLALPQVAGLSGGVTNGRGSVIGQVHDCDGVRLANVRVGFGADNQADRITYFNKSVVNHPLPDAGRAQLGTDPSGLYAAFNFAPGPVTVETAGFLNDGGALQSIGTMDARIYAGSVTLIGVNGGRPRSTVATDAGTNAEGL